MEPKPAHLGPAYAAQFQDQAIAAAYPARPPYPDEVFDILTGLIAGQADELCAVLDLGSGTGDIARPLARRLMQCKPPGRVDAVDQSQAMIARGRALSGGDAPNLNWILGAVEDAPLRPPYALVTAGESIHWMAWEMLFPRLRAVMAPSALLAIIERGELAAPWHAPMLELIIAYSTNQKFQPYDVLNELARRTLFTLIGQRRTAPVSVTQRITRYIEALHSRNGFSRDRMPPERATELDERLHATLAPYAQD
ncbi:MAG: class I SAM-dependent methyltransferase, partial [Ktedonobacterales bacterium]